MLSLLWTYLQLGVRHILDVQGYDHILFVAALVAGDVRSLRRIALLVTAFTIGHSVTLALATLDLVRADPAWVEFLIPLTILVTSILNIASAAHDDETATSGRAVTRYSLALFFGLIHGLGFSNFLRAALGAEESIGLPLLGFNVGVELGQIAVVGVIAGGLSLARTVSVELRDAVLVLSGATGGVALIMTLERLPL